MMNARRLSTCRHCPVTAADSVAITGRARCVGAQTAPHRGPQPTFSMLRVWFLVCSMAWSAGMAPCGLLRVVHGFGAWQRALQRQAVQHTAPSASVADGVECLPVFFSCALRFLKDASMVALSPGFE